MTESEQHGPGGASRLVGFGLCLLFFAVGCGRSEAPARLSEPSEPSVTVDLAAELAPVEAPVPVQEPDPAPEAVAEDVGVEAPAAPVPDPARLAQWASRVPRTVVDNQLFRRTTALTLALDDGRAGTVGLVELNPAVNAWVLVQLEWQGKPVSVFHLENTAPERQTVRLDASFPTGVILHRDGRDEPCDLWGAPPGALHTARLSGQTYAPVCGGWVSVRNAAVGRKTTMEWTTDFLRDHVWGGEQITVFVREQFFQDAELRTSELSELGAAIAAAASTGPPSARVDPAVAGKLLDTVAFGLAVDEAPAGRMEVGAWYPVTGVADAYASLFAARFADPAVAEALGDRADEPDEVERAALVYTIAFDLSQHTLGFELGTDHPRVGWSERARSSVVDPAMPGPDGFDTVAPLVRTGQVNPVDVPRLAAVVTGGFKRAHGAFKAGDLASVNGGSHYGFWSHGVELSRLQPGLATVVVWQDGEVELRTWTKEDDARLGLIRDARQNGVPVLEPDPETGEVRPGALVKSWAAGNWSGSSDGKQRSVRGGLCQVETDTGRYLLYSYFSTATPSAMARVYAAYGCDYAMLLDMNALEHTYLAVHAVEGGEVEIRHLVLGMEVLDEERGGILFPRFVGFPDNRDFFTVERRAAP